MGYALPQRFQALSAPAFEIVLPHIEALEALDLLERNGVKILGWEGWLRHSDGSIGHSARAQGTADLSGVQPADAYRLCRETLAAAHRAQQDDPERPDSDLLFCITHDA